MTYDISKYTNPRYNFYNYYYIQENFSELEIKSRCNKFKELFTQYTKNWTDETNSQWIVRNYLATKFILAADLLISSLEYSIKKDLLTVQPYLSYYSVFNSCRAYVLTLPNEKWSKGKIFELTHNKIIKITWDSLRTVNTKKADEFKEEILKLKSIRELSSYRFPSDGINNVDSKSILSFEYICNFCGLLCEMAQLNSELLEYSFKKNAEKREYSIVEDIYWDILEYEDIDAGIYFVDDEDYFRLRQFHKMNGPVNIACSMRQGLIDDFFSSWESDSDEDDSNKFSPHQIIFCPV